MLAVLVGVGRWLGDGGIGDDGVWGIVIAAYFPLGGVLFSTLAWRSQTANALPSPHKRR